MPATDRRATHQSRYEPEYSDYDSYAEDDYPAERRPRPRRKSTTRDIIDRVSRSFGRLGLADRSPSRTRPRARVVSPSPSPPPYPRRPAYSRHRSAESYYPPPPRPRNRRHGSSYSLSPPRASRGGTSRGGGRGRSPPPVDDRRFKQAARSALDAAVVEVMRVRKEPGSWTGGKGARVATAAIGAAAVDAFVTKDPDHHGKRKTIESTIGGLLLNRMVNGPRRELRKESRSRR